MRCFYVLLHGRLNWQAETAEFDEQDRPIGFYCHRYVLAPNQHKAAEIAFRRVRENLDEQTDWVRSGLATLDLQAEELSVAPMYKLLRPENRGHTFYCED